MSRGWISRALQWATSKQERRAEGAESAAPRSSDMAAREGLGPMGAGRAREREQELEQEAVSVRPTTVEIELAAYERWERRGHVHGQDRDDWYAAENELAFLKNYETIARCSLARDEGRVLGGGNGAMRRCRFCERTSAQTEFQAPRPVVPPELGPTSLLTAEICEDCQAEWRGALGADLAAFWNAALGGRGPFDTTESRSGPAFTVPVYKALVASAALLAPESELPSFVDAIEWASNPDHERDGRLFGDAACRVYTAPFLADHPWISLARRADPEAMVPYLILFLSLRGQVAQVSVPLCAQDEDLDGRPVDCPERTFEGNDARGFVEARLRSFPIVCSPDRPAFQSPLIAP